ncbi:hypothetical protein Rleg4DRAFT_1827 [Rhizobium leguminosarum bv. trifolii WSM2297]|uniref:Uncharacterized protein n=1 Tax=Rhizobium leguminosarum bv. trifolii WSM2297 TaxID=754762 RepID=J0KRT6_RHILT|nr:hypothetical protein Rleg4DRAFT_1827 [Rhizobium leguminosarum bv. trifolii WSM2297]
MERIHPDDLPLCSEEIAVCQRALEIVNLENGFERASDESDFLAWRVIGFYRRGVQDPGELVRLLRQSAARIA